MRSSRTTKDWGSATALNATDHALAYAHSHRLRIVSELKEFVRFPSISAQPEHAEDLKRCAAWLADQLRRIGPIDCRYLAMRTAFSAYRSGFGAIPVFMRSGGTIPVIALLRDILGMQTVLMGFALPDDLVHAPNEKFHLPNFFNGITTSIRF